MASYRLLILGKRGAQLESLPGLVTRQTPDEIRAEATSAISDALNKLSRGGYNVAICWADRDDELAAVIRIRRVRPDLPIMVLTSRNDSDFADLAREAGATRTTCWGGEPEALSEQVRLMITSGDLVRELNEQTKMAHAAAQEVSRIASETRRQIASAHSLLFRPRPEFTALLVEDDADQARLMAHAFRKAGVDAPLPIVGSGEEFVDLFTRSQPDLGSGKQPCPSVIILDYELPGMSGLEVLEWIRRHPATLRLPVVMLSAVSEPAKVNRAYELGVNSFLTKPTSFAALVEVVKSIRAYWGGMNLGPGP